MSPTQTLSPTDSRIAEGSGVPAPLPGGWSAELADDQHFEALAAFTDRFRSGGGRKFPANVAGLADVFHGRVPQNSHVLYAPDGTVGGYTVLYSPSSSSSVVSASVQLAPEAPEAVRHSAVRSLRQAFETDFPHVETLRIFGPVSTSTAGEVLLGEGFEVEATFWGKRRALTEQDRHIDPLPGITVVDWAQVESRGLGDAVRRAQYETFLRHFGALGKTESAWQHHLAGPVFAPRFSFAALDESSGRQVVAGYALGSNYTDDTLGDREVNAHTDYLGVRGGWRGRGIAGHLLRHVWRSALEAGLSAASLGVDAHNEHNAGALYDALGYRTIAENAAYRFRRSTTTSS